MKTKAQQIMELYAQAVGTMPERQITKFVAGQLGTTDSYVRTVARQRLGRGQCEAERRYAASPLGRAKIRRCGMAKYRRIKADPERYAAYRATARDRYHRRRRNGDRTDGAASTPVA